MSSLIERLAYLVKTKRKDKGITTHELAAILNVSSGLINNIENARSDVFKLYLLTNLAKELDIPLIEIIVGELTSIKDKNTIDKDGKIELLISENKFKSIECLYEYIPALFDSLIDLILRFEKKDVAAQEVCELLLHELNCLKTLSLMK